MIELPDTPAPNGMECSLIDYGFVQRGAASVRVDRPGSRYRVSFTYPPMQPDVSRKFIARLSRAKRTGIKVKLPLLVDQGRPGAPVVDGADQAGTALAVRGLTPGYIAREGYWLTLIEADGSGCLHQMAETAIANNAGTAVLSIEPPLRVPMADGDQVEMGEPFVAGFLDGNSFDWQVPLHRLIAVAFTVEEMR